MSYCWPRAVSLGVSLLVLTGTNGSAEEELDVGARAFRACAACHSLSPGRHMTGPSLAGIWQRKAGSVEGFQRYSPALSAADLVWNEATLHAWIADPGALVPGNRMTFAGIKDKRARQGLIALLKAGEAATARVQRAPQGTMGGMMQAPAVGDLKSVEPSRRVSAISYCGDTYRVTTADGDTNAFWEMNLRFKTDSSENGPEGGQPAIMPAGMMGDRASVIFADPAEISKLIERRC